MAKASGVQDLLIEKGEKIGLGIAGGVGGLMLVLGVASMFGRSQNPEEFAKQIDSKAAGLTSQINSPNGATIDPVSPDLVKPVTNNLVALQPLSSVLFDPNAPPDGRRLAPVVLRIVEGQADIAVVKIAASDITLEKNGDRTLIKAGVVSAIDPKEKITGSGKFLTDMKNKLGRAGRNIRLPNQGGNNPGGPAGPGGAGLKGGSGGPGGMGGGPTGFPGGMGGGGPTGFPGGMGGFPGGARGGPGFGLGGGSGGGPPGGMTPGGIKGGGGGEDGAGGGSMPGMMAQGGTRYQVEYIEGETDEELEAKMKGRRLAITISPERMAVLQASFPYRAELERYRQALQYQTMEQLYARPDEMPTFNGVEVQRRVSRANGMMVEDWTPLPFVENGQQLRAIKLLDRDDPADLAWVSLHEDNQLVMPLPTEVTGKYPDLELKTLKDTIKKLKDSNARPNLPAPPSRFKGEINPFGRSSVGSSGNLFNAGNRGTGGGGDDAEGGMGAGMRRGGGFMMPTKPGGGNKSGENPNQPSTSGGKIEPPDYIYIRVFDTDIKDGMVYHYRMRARLLNPNFGKRDLVSKSSDADNKELAVGEEHWFEFSQPVAVPKTSYQYVIDAPPAAKGQPAPPKPGQAIMQIHRFEQRMEIPEQRLNEPVGDWVLGELTATKGLYLQGKAFAPLPFWSSITNDFELRPLPGEKATVVKGPKKDVIEPRKGVLFEPIRPRTIIAADVSGGQVKEKVPNNPGERSTRTGTIADEVSTNVLLMYPDGSLELKSSAVDKADVARKSREENWKKWVNDTIIKSGGAPVGPGPKGPGDV